MSQIRFSNQLPSKQDPSMISVFHWAQSFYTWTVFHQVRFLFYRTRYDWLPSVQVASQAAPNKKPRIRYGIESFLRFSMDIFKKIINKKWWPYILLNLGNSKQIMLLSSSYWMSLCSHYTFRAHQRQVAGTDITVNNGFNPTNALLQLGNNFFIEE